MKCRLARACHANSVGGWGAFPGTGIDASDGGEVGVAGPLSGSTGRSGPEGVIGVGSSGDIGCMVNPWLSMVEPSSTPVRRSAYRRTGGAYVGSGRHTGIESPDAPTKTAPEGAAIARCVVGGEGFEPPTPAV